MYIVDSNTGQDGLYLLYDFDEVNSRRNKLVEKIPADANYCSRIDCIISEIEKRQVLTNEYRLLKAYNEKNKTDLKYAPIDYFRYVIHDFGIDEILEITYSFRNSKNEIEFNLRYVDDAHYNFKDCFKINRLGVDPNYSLFIEKIRFKNIGEIAVNSFFKPADSNVLKIEKEVTTYKKKHSREEYSYLKRHNCSPRNKIRFDSEYRCNNPEDIYEGYEILKDLSTFKLRDVGNFHYALQIYLVTNDILSKKMQSSYAFGSGKTNCSLKVESNQGFLTHLSFYALLPLLKNHQIEKAYLDSCGSLRFDFSINIEDAFTLLIIYYLSNSRYDLYRCFIPNIGYFDTSLVCLNISPMEDCNYFKLFTNLKGFDGCRWIYSYIPRRCREVLGDLYVKQKDFDFKTRWQSEFMVYLCIKMIYPDAIYQYRNKKIDKYILDIFIPSLNVGIEYQGKQHYKPVELFGGGEKLKKRQRDDTIKLELCKKAGFKIAYIKYNECHCAEDLYNILNKQIPNIIDKKYIGKDIELPVKNIKFSDFI